MKILSNSFSNIQAMKMLIVGTTAVGKTAILLRFCVCLCSITLFKDDTFSEEYVATIGVDFVSF